MITENMTAEEVSNTFKHDRVIIARTLCKMWDALERRLKGASRRKNVVLKPVHVFGKNNSEYICVVYYNFETNSKRHITFGVCKGEKPSYIAGAYAEYSWSYTSHFMKRYAERCLHNADASIDEILMDYIPKSYKTFPIWNKDNDTVFAFSEGIIISSKKDSNIMKAITFVSNDMLGKTQSDAIKSAFDSCNFIKYKEFYDLSHTPFWYYTEQYDEYLELFEKANEIYDSYYDD